MPQALIALFTNLAGVIGGALNGVLGTAVSMMKAGTKAALQFHQEGISLARDLGMGLNQANAYTKVLTERTQELAAKYGVTSDAIKAVQRNISETTGKQLILNDAQAEGFVQANKLVGEQTTNRFMDTIINGMGGQVSTVQGAISKAYATAMKQGLNAQKFSKTVADNLSMANRLNFRNGIDGITRMAAMAEKFGLSMKSVETAAGQFMELDSAIEHSAHLQMLGGSIGAAFSNPLQNAYESMYDPEALAKRMEDAMKGMATFDAKKGYATMSGINQEILRNYAKEMGLNAEEVIGNAKKMAEVRYKENKFSDKLGGLQLSEDQKNFLINNGQVSEGGNELLFNGQNVNNMSPDELKKQLDSMMQFEGKSDTDILKDQAISLKSIEETIKGNAESIGAAFAKGLALDENAQNIIKHIDSYGKTLQDVSENLGQGAGKALNGILNFVNKNEDTLKNIANGIVKVSKFLADNWKGLLIAIGAWKLLLNPLLGLKLGKDVTVGGKLGAKALGGISKGLKGLFTTSRDTNIATRMGYADARASGSGRFMSVLKAPFRGASFLSTTQKIANVGGAALGVGISAAQGIMAQSSYKDQLDAINRGEWDRERYKTKEEAMAGAQTERNEGVGGAVGSGVGTVIGTALGGPVGAMIGGAIGKFAGEYIGKNWTKITDWFSKGWDKVVKYFTSIDWGKVGETLISVFLPPVGAIIQVVKHWDEITAWVGEKWDGAMSKLSVLWQDIKDGWNNYIEQPFKEYVLQPIKDVVKWTDENILQPVKSFFAKVKEGWDKLMGGIQKFLDDPWGSIKQGAKNTYEDAKGWAKEKWDGAKGWVKGLFSEKHASGGIVGGNSYSGDRILTGLNSGEMVLNKDQQAQLFKFIQNASNILTKIGSSNGVTYYNASNKYSNLTSSYDTSRISSILDNRSIRQRHSAIHNNVGGNVFPSNDNRSIREKHSAIHNNVGGNAISSYDNRSIRQRHSAIHNNVGGNILSNILSTIFNSNSYDNRSIRQRHSAIRNNVGGNVFSSYDDNRSISAIRNNVGGNAISSYDNRSIKEKHSAIHNNVGGNILSNILSTIFNSTSDVVSSALNTNNNIKTVPFGENSFRKIPKTDYTEYSYNKGGEITVRDINVKVNGTIKLDGGNSIKNLDINQLLNDTSFVSSLKELIKQSINNDINGGRIMNDNALRRGMVTQTSLWGRK